ncbi:MAG: hypothetical protein C0617_11110 [Desulfuromonas sp.]|uniref:YcjF family protein n=1 Tax=Desulfuromonas sp. TaxID=892 RepID=UPI000CA7D9B2|nr:hypothetical protein [Desulfuromonas sp.]PLX83675.1 MAG: hypothetical protein C0617_11110 [Desulfuromonas sp.]
MSTEEKVKKVIEKALKGVRENILEIETRTDLPNEEKAKRIIKIFGATCAGVAIQPIPFADIFILTPIQAYMGTRIAAIRGVPVRESEVGEIIKEIAAVVGLGLLAQQLVIGGYKTFIPFLGAWTTIPIVFGLTYAMGCVMDEYFIRKAKKEKLDKEIMKQVWRDALKVGKEEGKKRTSEIKKDSKALRPEED